jgi:gliding motility-associated-like protein
MDYEFVNAVPGEYRFRLAVAEPANFNSPLCRTLSPLMTIYVNKYPVPKAISNRPCVGDDLILDVAEATGTYKWFDPQGNEISTLKAPVIKAASLAMIGKYKVIVTNGGCAASAEVDVNVIPPPEARVDNAAVQVCEGSAVELRANGGTIYTWSPAAGLSSTEIANPMANAGEDKKILLGGNTTLNGSAAGDQVSYFWSPSAGLDDPTKLNPTASPIETTTYTLNVTSALGCTTAVDQALVLVYQDLVIPASFSPNGDGTNDLWNITAIDTYVQPKVSIMNRYGELIYETTDYYLKPWNGKRNNVDVPVGVYFYLITVDPEKKPFSGSVTLIR